MRQYKFAPDVRSIAKDLIPTYHGHLQGLHIEYLMSNDAPTSKGIRLPGRVKLVQGLNAVLSSPADLLDEWHEGIPFFAIIVSASMWEELDGIQKRALVDHFLCHCDIDAETSRLKVTPPAFGEYRRVVARHGDWRPTGDLRRFTEFVHEQLQSEDTADELAGVS